MKHMCPAEFVFDYPLLRGIFSSSKLWLPPSKVLINKATASLSSNGLLSITIEHIQHNNKLNLTILPIRQWHLIYSSTNSDSSILLDVTIPSIQTTVAEVYILKYQIPKQEIFNSFRNSDNVIVKFAAINAMSEGPFSDDRNVELPSFKISNKS